MSPSDMRLVAASDVSAGAVGTEHLAAYLCGPLGCCRLLTLATTVAFANPPPHGRTELPAALGSWFARAAQGLGLVTEVPGRMTAAGWLRRAV
jgi:hypothetical protein